MAEAANLVWFQSRVAVSRAIEATDPAPLLAWRDRQAAAIEFKAELIGLDDAQGWSRDPNGNIRHRSGQFFGVEGVRVSVGGNLREIGAWEQPIFTQREGGILVMVARETPARGVEFLLQAKAEPGNIGILQFSPSIQATWSNINRAHEGRRPPLVEVMLAKRGARMVYRAQHCEEGGRFWRKSNENIIMFLDDEGIIEADLAMFAWASLSQIKRIALMDNVLSPFVKTILAPL